MFKQGSIWLNSTTGETWLNTDYKSYSKYELDSLLIQQSFSDRLLAVKTPNLIHKIISMKDNLPKYGGGTLRMRPYCPEINIPKIQIEIPSEAFSEGRNAYDIYITGKDGTLKVKHEDNRSRFIYTPQYYGGVLATNATVGYKFASVPKIMNDSWIVNMNRTLEHGELIHIPSVLLNINYA